MQLPDGDGIALLRRLQQLDPNLFVLVITAYATVENAVEAFHAGASDYLVKPVLFEDLRHKLDRLFRFRQLYLENQSLRRELTRQDAFGEIVGSSIALCSFLLDAASLYLRLRRRRQRCRGTSSLSWCYF